MAVIFIYEFRHKIGKVYKRIAKTFPGKFVKLCNLKFVEFFYQ